MGSRSDDINNFQEAINNPENIKILKNNLVSYVSKIKNTQGIENTPDKAILAGKEVIANFFSNLSAAYNRQLSHLTELSFILDSSIHEGSVLESYTLEEIRVLSGSDPHNKGKQSTNAM